MARTVGAYEAKTHLSRLLDEVAEGETITITRRGTPVAVLSPPFSERQRADALAAIERWEAYRDQHDITLGDDLTIRQLIEEGRRY